MALQKYLFIFAICFASFFSVDTILSAIPVSLSPAPRAPTPTQSTQSTLTGLDGNAAPQDTLPAGLQTTNKIKINITKNVTNKIVINTSENSDKPPSSEGNACDSPLAAGHESTNDEALSTGGHNGAAPVVAQPHSHDEAPARRASPEPEIEFEYKATMRNKPFQRMTKVCNGLETSGLCSIM